MATSDVTTKTCAYCKVTFPATSEYFGKDKGKTDGFYSRCRKCAPIRKAHELLPDGTRRCTKCKQLLVASGEHFYVEDAKRNKLRANCRTCDSKKSQDYHASHRIERHEKRITKRDKDAEYRRTHKPEISESNKRWSKANPENIRTRRENYRARKIAGGDCSLQDVELQIRSQTDRSGFLRCWWCGKPIEGIKYHIDHRVPLSRGGSNMPENIVIVHPKCNLSKSNKLPGEWNGRLL